MTSTRVLRTLTRTRGGGVVISKARVAKEVADERSSSFVENKKLRVTGLPNRRAGHLRKR